MPYQPFMTQIGKTLGGAVAQQGQNELMQAAYMGKPGALEQLSAVNPQAAQQIQQSKKQEKQQELQAQDRKSKAIEQLRKVKADVQENLKNFKTFEEAKSYYDQQVQMNQELINLAGVTPEQLELTPEGFEQIKQVTKKTPEDDQVQSAKIMDTGLVQIVRKSGKVDIVEPTQANKELIAEAERRGAELQGLRSGERGAASEAIKAASEAFKTLSSTRKNIANMEEGIKLLEEGAETGVVDQYLPSIREASIKLDNLQGRLGLDVVGATSFGALSESELKFAKDVAMPPALKPKALAQWFKDKKEAQEKLAANLEETALFLGEPGNTIADFIKMKKEEKAKEDETAGGKAIKTAGPPKTGDIISGYRFKGGDPSKKENWELQ